MGKPTCKNKVIWQKKNHQLKYAPCSTERRRDDGLGKDWGMISHCLRQNISPCGTDKEGRTFKQRKQQVLVHRTGKGYQCLKWKTFSRCSRKIYVLNSEKCRESMRVTRIEPVKEDIDLIINPTLTQLHILSFILWTIGRNNHNSKHDWIRVSEVPVGSYLKSVLEWSYIKSGRILKTLLSKSWGYLF